MKTKILFLAAFLLCASGAVMAQTKVEVKRADLSVPFGTVYGKVVLVGDYLTFIDEEQPQSSFAIARSEIQNITSDGGMVNIETKQPVRDRSGERSRLSFRLIEGDLVMLINWSQMTPSTTTSATTSGGGEAGQMIYQARHNHRIGGCRGRLIVNDEMIAYESTDRIQDSRRWQLKDVKQIRQRNPYEIEVDPFVGDRYRLQLEGKGMDSREFKALVDRIAAARIAR